MTRVVIHRLASTKRALDACRLLERLHLAGKKVLVYFTDPGRAATFDDYLWTFSKLSFVPHSLWDGHSRLEEDIVLAVGTVAAPNGAKVLVLLDPLPDVAAAAAFEEVHDFLTPLPEDADKLERWRAAGFTVS